jgi:SAM-dependent methyltransferase
MIKGILRYLRLPELSGKNLDDPGTTERHARIIKQKSFLRKIYVDCYKQYQDALAITPGGIYVELGSGGGFVKDIIPNVITSDILSLSNIDIRFSAQNMPFRDESVDAFFMFNVFHHIKDPSHILRELNRCLRPGGKIVMIEPANTLWGRFVWQHFHHEVFDPSAGWAVEGEGPLSSGNGAIPWIIFCRDREEFERRFPSLPINRIRYQMSLRYLISGGVSMRSLLPSIFYPVIKGIEFLLSPFNRWIGMFFAIEIEKTASACL